MQIVITVADFDELKAIAKQILGGETVTAPVVTPDPPVIPVLEETPAEPVEAVEEPVKAEEPKTYTQAEVRKVLGDLRKAGKKEEVTMLMNSLGYEKFTDIPADLYPELMEKAREL